MAHTEVAGKNPLEALIEHTQALKPEGQVAINFGNLLECPRPFAEAIEAVKTQSRAHVRIITPPILIEDDEGYNGILYLRDRGIPDELLYNDSIRGEPYYHLIETEEGVAFYQGARAQLLTPLIERREEPNPDRDRLVVLGLIAGYVPSRYPQNPPSSTIEFRLQTFEDDSSAIKEYTTKPPWNDWQKVLPFVTTREGLAELIRRRDRVNFISAPYCKLMFVEPPELIRLGQDLFRPAS